VVADLDESSLKLIQSSKQKGKMRNSILFNLDVNELGQANRAKLDELERKYDQMSVLAAVIGGTVVGSFALYPLSALASFPALWRTADSLATISQRFLLMKDLVEAFEDEQVEIEVELSANGVRTIDLFLRFPDKEYILLQLRSLGKCRLVFNPEKQVFQYRRKKGGGLKTWKPDPVTELIEQERWLRRQRSDLLGMSSRDKRRQIAKAIILWSDSTLGDHPEHLYATIDDQKYLMVKTTGSAFIVEKDQVINFIRAYLNSRRSQKTSENN
jgi:hypothetical protein